MLFEASPMPMWVYDAETLAFLAVNDAAIRHYGYTRDEFLRDADHGHPPARGRPGDAAATSRPAAAPARPAPKVLAPPCARTAR